MFATKHLELCTGKCYYFCEKYSGAFACKENKNSSMLLYSLIFFKVFSFADITVSLITQVSSSAQRLYITWQDVRYGDTNVISLPCLELLIVHYIQQHMVIHTQVSQSQRKLWFTVAFKEKKILSYFRWDTLLCLFVFQLKSKYRVHQIQLKLDTLCSHVQHILLCVESV